MIGGQAGAFADGGNSRAATSGSPGVFQGRLGIGVNQLARGHQMSADEFSGQLAEGPQFRTNRRIQQFGVGTGWKCYLGPPRRA